MKKMISILAALTMLASCAAAENSESISIIGGADGPTDIYLSSNDDGQSGSAVIAFDANSTTGYEWTAFILGGDSVGIDEEASGYVPDPNPDNACGVGGKHYFKLNALKPGESIIRFRYGRSWEEDAAEERIILAVVEDGLLISTMDVTETGVLDGTVTEVNGEEHSVTLTTDKLGEVSALFDDNMAMPVNGEHIKLYTNGTMTMSLPPIVNVIAWESVPDGNAREGESSLPAYQYTGSDPIGAAVAEYTVQLAESIGYYQEDVNVTIPAPVILKVEKTDDDHAKVYGNFWHMNYTLAGDTLLCVSGGEAPGVLELTRDGDQWKVTGAELAGDGEDYYNDIARFCNGDTDLEDQYFSACDVQTDPLRSVRHRFIHEYVTANGLPVTAYQDEYWDPIPLE